MGLGSIREFDAVANSISYKETKKMATVGKELRKCNNMIYAQFGDVNKPV